MIIIIDFGSQTAHLISRRIKELGVEAKVVVPEVALDEVKKIKPSGIIFSGGPLSVYEPNAPTIDKKIFSLNLPILGICYGQQLISYLLGGEVKQGKEYGPASVRQLGGLQRGKPSPAALFNNIPDKFQVWMSHGDAVIRPPKGFAIDAESEHIACAAISDETKKIYAVQFHPELQHTQYGMEIFKNFMNICGEQPRKEEIDIKILIETIKETVGDNKVIMAFSGGTDSSVAGALIAKAIGKNLIPVYVESGLTREKALYNIEKVFPKVLGITPTVIHAEALFLKRLKGVTDPELKRKSIGKLYIELFDKEAKKYKNVKFLAQGTTYADFIHSMGTKHAALIKSHHNVGGLPEQLKLTLLEPIRYFYTDQVRYIGEKLGLPKDIVYQQPFPGPGFAVRIMGEVTKENLAKVKHADKIVMEEIEKAGLKDEIFQYFAIVTGSKSTAVKGDGRFYGDVIAIRAYTTKDRMSADWAKIPYEVLARISARIVNEVTDVSRVVYDITTKPPATMEWE